MQISRKFENFPFDVRNWIIYGLAWSYCLFAYVAMHNKMIAYGIVSLRTLPVGAVLCRDRCRLGIGCSSALSAMGNHTFPSELRNPSEMSGIFRYFYGISLGFTCWTERQSDWHGWMGLSSWGRQIGANREQRKSWKISVYNSIVFGTFVWGWQWRRSREFHAELCCIASSRVSCSNRFGKRMDLYWK